MTIREQLEFKRTYKERINPMGVEEYCEIFRKMHEGLEAFRQINKSSTGDAAYMGEFMGVMLREKNCAQERIEYVPWDEIEQIIKAEYIAVRAHLQRKVYNEEEILGIMDGELPDDL